MKAMIIAFLTSLENYDSQSVTNAIGFFGLPEEDDQELTLGRLGQKLESYFHAQRVEISDWIADEDLEAFDEMVAAYEAL